METKFIEIRDSMTFIPALALKMDGNDSWLAWRAGYSKTQDYILLMHLNQLEATYDPYKWSNGRTMFQAHKWLQDNWDSVEDGGMVDVEHILGEKQEQSTTEQSCY